MPWSPPRHPKSDPYIRGRLLSEKGWWRGSNPLTGGGKMCCGGGKGGAGRQEAPAKATSQKSARSRHGFWKPAPPWQGPDPYALCGAAG